MDRAEGVLLVAELALREARAVSVRVDEIPSARISKSFVVNTNGELVVIYDDGTTSVVGEVKGKDGKSTFITEGFIDDKGCLIFKFDDERVINVGLVKGQGPKGEDGVGVEGIEINDLGELVVELTNKEIRNLGKVVGEKGLQGLKGDRGQKGDLGLAGKDGESIKGDRGLRGETGLSGADGKDATQIEIGDAFLTGISDTQQLLSRLRVMDVVIDSVPRKVLVLE